MMIWWTSIHTCILFMLIWYLYPVYGDLMNICCEYFYPVYGDLWTSIHAYILFMVI